MAAATPLISTTVAPTSTPVITVTPTPTPAIDVAEKEMVEEDTAKYIPGIVSADITINLENYIKMEFSGPKKFASEFTDKGSVIDPDTSVDMSCDIYGDLPSHIRKVELTVVGYEKSLVNSTAGYYFGYVASLPYDGADPAVAKKWAEDSVKAGGNKETTIGGVKFEIVGGKTSRILTISRAIPGQAETDHKPTKEEQEAIDRLGE